MNAITTVEAGKNEITRTDAIGQLANVHAAKVSFADYTSRKAANTLRAQLSDLVTFSEFLSVVEIDVTADSLQNDSKAWAGMTWGLVSGFVQWMLSQGFATGTINRKLSTVRMYAKLAVKAGTLSQPEYAQMKLVSGYSNKEAKRIDEKRDTKRMSTKKADHVSLSSLQVEQLKAQPLDTEQGARDALLICLLLDHGLRCGELTELTVDGVDVDSGSITFYRPKVDKTDTQRLTADTMAALAAYLPYMPTNGGLLRASRKGGKLTDNAMSDRAITKRVKALGADHGIDSLSAHDLRHSWATRAAKGGTDAFALRDAGGWSSLVMPSKYVESNAISNERVKLA